jgi:nucleoside-diphosphate-sugar epimerase
LSPSSQTHERNPLAPDLEFILERTRDLWEEVRGERIFITGGTGFFGCWFLESFCWINRRLSLDATAVVLSRNAKAFVAKAPHLAADPAVRFHAGDVRSFSYPDGAFSHVIHGATAASAKLNDEDPLLMLDTIVEGTRHTLDFARDRKVRKFLLTSSGAVYGPQPAEMTHIPETFPGSPDTMNPGSVYGEGKRVAELLCAVYHRVHGIETKIARCFAFAGPYLPLDVHFAIGNFVRDSMAGNAICVNGDGTPHRSYLYAADLMIWLWTILFAGAACRPYNVGSEDSRDIKTIAETVIACSTNPSAEIRIMKPPSGSPPLRYVPSTGRAQAELGLRLETSLEAAISRWVKILELATDGAANRHGIV